MTRSAEGKRPLRVGIFGGTFDPPHVGHVSVARDVADALDLDRVLWVPVRLPPHKSDVAVSAAFIRLEMVAAATAADPRFDASEIELNRPGPSYTVDTVRELRTVAPDAELFLIIGADQVRTLDTWREPEEVLRLATLVLMDRAGEAAREVAPPLQGIEGALHVPVGRVDVSSSEVRARVAAGEDVSGMVPESVSDIILREGLYVR